MMSLPHTDNLTYLELLPPELQWQILKNIPNMKTLHALIRASPRYFQVYRVLRKSILPYIAWNQITPAIVPIALEALKRRDHIKVQSNHTEPLASKRTPKGPLEISFETWERLVQFHEVVECFIFSFTSNRLTALENSLCPRTQSSLLHNSQGRKLNLSQVEYVRLARAFYNLELYGNLFHDLDKLTPRRATTAYLWRAANFLQSLQDWELEELLCVRSYMMERLKDYLNKFEDDFMEAFIKNRPYITWPSEDASGFTSRSELLSEQGYLWLQDSWIEGCLTRGLETLSEMFSTNTLPGKFGALGERVTLGKYMSKALNIIPACSGWQLAEKMKPPQIWIYDNIDQPNEAWFWAMKFRGHSRTYHRKIHDADGWDYRDLECWGYVIWDHERLKRLKILTKR